VHVRRGWCWAVPLGASFMVLALVLLLTPPGFASIGDVVFGLQRGARAEAAAYALGAAASLSLLTLLILWALCAALDALVRSRGR
jgi:hypothetical protein